MSRLLMCIVTLVLVSSIGNAYTPDHPEVMRMINKGVSFLKSASSDHPHHKLGSDILYAYAVYKVNHDPSDPVVQKGVANARAFIASQTSGRSSPDFYITYAGSLSMLLLLDVDAEKYRQEINTMARFYLSLQKPHGGFSYPNDDKGDNSQNQYAVLAMWSLRKAKFDVSPQAMERVAMYISRTQDPSGMWGYKGVLPSGGGLAPQDTKRISLTSACAGSLLIAGDFFGFYKDVAQRRKKSEEDGLPPAVHVYDPEEAQRRLRTTRFNESIIDGSISRTSSFYSNNTFRLSNFPNTFGFYFYALYAHERFMSFLEKSEGGGDEEPAWYNQGVEDLKRVQEDNGAWGGPKCAKAGITPYLGVKENTAFAILFLIRSTKRAIAQAQAGTAKGGFGLPGDPTNMKVTADGFKDVASDGVEKLLDLLDQGDETIDPEKMADSMTLSKNPAERADQIKRLKRMVKGGPWQARRAAARLLGQSSDLDIVPTLIYALSDPDSVVRREARNGLRFVSRKFEGFGLPDKPNEKQVDDAIRDWKEWYLRANPSYVFLDAS